MRTMRMNSVKTAWTKILNSGEIPNNGFLTSLISERSPHSFYVGVTSSSNILFAIETLVNPPFTNRKSVALEIFKHQRSDKRWLTVIELKKIELQNVFETLCQDLYDTFKLLLPESDLIKRILQRIDLWFNLFLNNPTGLLENYQIRGLFGELFFMNYLLESEKYTAETIISCWQGPLRSAQDFIFKEQAFEIKTIGPESEELNISSLNQLLYDGKLSLITIEIMNSPIGTDNSFNLNSLVAHISNLIENPVLLNVFNSKLLLLGFVKNDHYVNINYELSEIKEYDVDDRFPKLTTVNTDKRITSASYSIWLESIQEFGNKL